jgi:hypothetical protein
VPSFPQHSLPRLVKNLCMKTVKKESCPRCNLCNLFFTIL